MRIVYSLPCDARVLIGPWAYEASAALAAAYAVPVELESAPPQPGLYAIHAGREIWVELGIGEPPDERPLYVGKSESSLAGRDIGTHFGYAAGARATSVTGGSTVRRSLAALLHDKCGFRGVPRNMQRPSHYSNYGLTREQDLELSKWMRECLRLACWPLPRKCGEALERIEQDVLRRLLPPLNLKDVVTPWKPDIEASRRVMAAEARGFEAER